MRKLISTVMVLVLSITVLLPNIAYAQESNVQDNIEFQLMVDEFMKEAMEKYHVPGVTLSVVKDGEVYFKQGYGYSDLANKTPVNPDETLFRIGSITKLFTATATMQLYERGYLDLEDEVNKYLVDEEINYYKGEPIKIKHLLTHTGGFDDRLINIISDDIYGELPDLKEYLKENMPKTIRKPGEIMQYSNHGITLLGHILENASDQRIDKYLEQEIFEKLNMHNTYYYFTTDLVEKTAKGYMYSKGQYKPIKPTRVLTHPAGSILATSDDMAKFLIVHLKGGAILSEETLNNMHKTQFTHHEGMLGNAYGFYESLRGNYKTIEHGGDTPDFSSLLSFLPEKKLGFFISSNSKIGGGQLREDFANEFYAYFLEKAPSRGDLPNSEDEAELINVQDYVGNYGTVRAPRESIFKILGLDLLAGHVTVKEIDENTISVKDKIEEEIYYRVQGKLFRNKMDNSLLTFEKDSQGSVHMIKEKFLHMGVTTGMHSTFERINKVSSIIERSMFIPLIVAIIYLIVMLITSVKKNSRKYVGNELRAKQLMILTALIILAESGLLAWLIIKLINTDLNFNGIVVIIHILSFVLLGLTIAATIFTGLAWKQKYWSLKERVLHTVVNLTAVIMVVFTAYINCLDISNLIESVKNLL